MAEWSTTLGSPREDSANKGYWVGDTDGWYYWSKALDPGEATALLLDQITIAGDISGKFYYGIHVTSQMATAGDWGDASARTGFYADGLTAEALALLNQAATPDPVIRGVSITEGTTIYVKAGESVTLHPDVDIQNPTGAAAETAVTWDITADEGNFADGILTTAAGDIGKSYTVTVSTAAMPDVKTATVTIIVYQPEGIGTVGPMSDDKYYVDYGDNTFKEIHDDGTLGSYVCPTTVDKPGESDDRTVVVNSSGTKLLGQNPDGSYYVKGEVTDGKDGLLGTTDDPKVWPGGSGPSIDTPTTVNPNISYSVELTQVPGTGGAANSMGQGQTIRYTAVVKATDSFLGTTENAVNQMVQWELVAGTYVSGTVLSAPILNDTGITVTAAATETIVANRIGLKATAQEGGATATVNISVTERTLEKFTDSEGVSWLVLTDDGNGHKLIMTEYVYGFDTKYDIGGLWKQLDTGTTLKTALQNFYSGTMGSEIGTAAVSYEFPLADVRTAYNDGAGWQIDENQPSGRSKVGSDPADKTNGSNVIFVLSISEYNEWLPVANRVANDATATDTPRVWWLRSPGTSVATCTNMSTSGVINGVGAASNLGRGFRPALWVDSSLLP
jgi:hypothetical protein